MKMVRTLADQLTIPVFVKIRLLTTVEESLELCQQLIDSGAALIAIHARYRVNLVGRTGTTVVVYFIYYYIYDSDLKLQVLVPEMGRPTWIKCRKL